MIRLNKFTRLTFRMICCVLLVCCLCCKQAMATDPVMTGRTTMKVSEIGDSEVKVALQTHVNYYTALKQVGGNFQLLARQIGMGDRNWSSQDNLTGNFIDSNNEVDILYSTPGAARNVKGNRWVIQVQGDKACQLVSATDTHVLLMMVHNSEHGLGTMVIDVELPVGATKAAFDSHKREVSYDFTPQIQNGTHPNLDFEVDHKSMLMSSLAKNYSNPKFNFLWAARAVAKNSGDQILENYRVRFRVAEMGSWGAWQRSAHLYPGQSVIDPFFPIFDLEKVMSLNGSRPAVIEVEYEYEVGGQKVHESDSFPTQLLSRNEVVFSSLKSTEITGFADQFDYAPSLLTAMTTPADPVVQQLAGRINGMAAESYGQSIAASSADDHCVAYMSAVWQFLKSNRVAYQTPPGMLTQGNAGQHIKYTRDVLRNRAGTCVDLSLTWASICEAVGLEPAIILVPGHAFPAVRLPGSKQWLAIESTMLDKDFNAAIERGKAELIEAQKGQHFLIDITAMRKTGILGLDLQNVSEEYLTNLGYTFVAQKFETAPVANTNTNTNTNTNQTQPTPPATEQETATRTNDATQAAPETENETVPEDQQTTEATSDAETTFTPNGDQVELSALTGVWAGMGELEGTPVAVCLRLEGDSRFVVALVKTEADGTEKTLILKGTWGRQGAQLVLTDGADNTPYCYDFEFTGNQLKLCILGGDNIVTLDLQN